MRTPSTGPDEAFLELDDGDAPPAPPPVAIATDDGEAFLEVADGSVGPNGASSRVVSDDDVRTVAALGEDHRPLLDALFPSEPALLRDPPDAARLQARLAFVHRALNQVTRRGAEWRARAEVASAALARRLDTLRARGDLATAARDELRAHHLRAVEDSIVRSAGSERALYPVDAARVAEEASARGVDATEWAALCEALGVRVHARDDRGWTPCAALPGAPRTLDDAATAIIDGIAQAVVALRDGAVSRWIEANRGPAELVEAARKCEAVARAGGTDDGVVAAWSLAWSLGREGVRVEGLLVTSPELLRAHLRAGRVDATRVRAHAMPLAAWFRRSGHGAVAAACEAVGRGTAHAEARLSWALGDALRLAAAPVADAPAFAREVLRRPEARAEALERLRDGTLVAWLEALPHARRDAAWARDLAQTPGEAAFWRGVYRHAPRAPLRVFIDTVGGARAVRFDGLADLRATARLAAAWVGLRDAHVRGELHAWLAQAAPGVDLDAPPDAPDDGALLRLLWSLGATGMVLPRGAASGFALDDAADVVAVWRRGPLALEAWLAHGVLGAWLERFHSAEGVSGLTLARAVERWGAGFGAGTLPSGVAALRCALLCGLRELPADPTRPGGADGRALAGFAAVDASRTHPAAWDEVFRCVGEPVAHGTALTWAARHVPSLGALLAASEPAGTEAVREALRGAGVPVPTAPLAEVLAEEAERASRRARARSLREEGDRIAARREAARSELERAARTADVERTERAQQSRREALRREVQREVARLEAEREDARAARDAAVERLDAERSLAEAERARSVAERALRASRDEASAAFDPSAFEERVRAVARQAAEQEAERVADAVEADRRAALAAAAERRAGEAAELEVRENARRIRAESMLTASLAELVALEGARRADAERAAESAARVVLAVAAGDTARAEAEEAAEAAAASLAAAREAEAARAWEASRAAAEAEIDALAQAERARRDEALRVAAETRDGADRDVDVDDGEAFTEDLRAEAGEGLDAPDEAWSADRRDIAHERLAASYEVASEEGLAALRSALDAWSEARPRHRLANLGAALAIDSVTLLPAFEAHVATRFEARATEPRRATAEGARDPLPVPAAAIDAGGGVDPWSLELPPVETWDALHTATALDVAESERPCTVCDAASPGRLRCDGCAGEGSAPCITCGGYGRARCGRCGGNGAVLAAGAGTHRCPACEGRGDLPCARCTRGRAPCPRCEGEGVRPCDACDGGVRRERPWLLREIRGVRARACVGEGLPPEVLSRVGVPGSEPDPVLFVEADAIDPAELARELPHDHLGAALADLLAAECARAQDGERAVRQQVVAWRYPVWRVDARLDGAPWTFWLHGQRRQVWAPRSPLDEATEHDAARVRDALLRDDADEALALLTALADEDPSHAAAADAALAFGDAVLALAERGELFAAQRLAGQGSVVRWPEAASRLVAAERIAGGRLQRRSPWGLLQDARSAFARGHDARAADLLRQLHAVAPDDAEGAALSATLGARFAGRAAAAAARGAPDEAEAVLAAAGSGGFDAFDEALAAGRRAALGARRRAGAVRVALLVGVLVVAVILAAMALHGGFPAARPRG